MFMLRISEYDIVKYQNKHVLSYDSAMEIELTWFLFPKKKKRKEKVMISLMVGATLIFDPVICQEEGWMK